MSDDTKAIDAAWAVLREKLGTEGWTVSEAFNFKGFFAWGWEARSQYEATRIAELERDAAWQPIETAPKTGEEILVGRPDKPTNHPACILVGCVGVAIHKDGADDF